MIRRSKFFGVLAGFVGAAIFLISALPADAAKRRGGRICKTDHFHYGSSSGQRSKKVALRTAIASWAGFTAWEYGGAWGSFKRARSKGVKCERDATGWGCNVEAVPCRRR